MNRLQKRCVIGTAGIHLLLLTILIFGPAFFNRQPKQDNTVLDVIPANLVDAALNSGVRDAQAPQPAPQAAVIPPSLQQPPPPLPAPAPKAVQPPAPTPAPSISPSLLEQFKEYFSHTKPPPTVTPDIKPVQRTEKSHDDNIKVNLTPVRHAKVSKKPTQDHSSDAQAINSTLNSLKHSLSASTHIDMPGDASAAYANYASVVQSVYEQNLLAHPEQAANESEMTKVSVTIANDGTVLSAQIISRSGDSAWDQTVQNTLDDVKFIARFPDGATEKERHYVLSFYPHTE